MAACIKGEDSPLALTIMVGLNRVIYDAARR